MHNLPKYNGNSPYSFSMILFTSIKAQLYVRYVCAARRCVNVSKCACARRELEIAFYYNIISNRRRQRRRRTLVRCTCARFIAFGSPPRPTCVGGLAGSFGRRRRLRTVVVVVDDDGGNDAGRPTTQREMCAHTHTISATK